MVTGDICDIESRLQEHDPNLAILFKKNGNYQVLYRDQHVMEWPRPLDDRLIKHMQRIDSHRGYDAVKEIDAHNDKLEQTIERDRLNYIEAAVKDSRRQLQREL